MKILQVGPRLVSNGEKQVHKISNIFDLAHLIGTNNIIWIMLRFILKFFSRIIRS